MNVAAELRKIAKTIGDKFPVESADLRHMARLLEQNADRLAERAQEIEGYWSAPDMVKATLLGSLSGRALAVSDMLRGISSPAADADKAVA